MKIYDLVKGLLSENEIYRNSDKHLIWAVWKELGYIKDGTITKENFMDAPHTESIRRVRQKIQENNENLQATDKIRSERKKIQDQKGTHVYREKVYHSGIDFEIVDGKARLI